MALPLPSSASCDVPFDVKYVTVELCDRVCTVNETGWRRELRPAAAQFRMTLCATDS